MRLIFKSLDYEKLDIEIKRNTKDTTASQLNKNYDDRLDLLFPLETLDHMKIDGSSKTSVVKARQLWSKTDKNRRESKSWFNPVKEIVKNNEYYATKNNVYNILMKNQTMDSHIQNEKKQE